MSTQQIGAGTLHAQNIMTYRRSLKGVQAFDVDVWPKVRFVGTDSITSNVSRFYSVQQNIGFMTPSPDNTSALVWQKGQNVIQIGENGELSWQMSVFEPGDTAQGLAVTDFFDGVDTLDCDPSDYMLTHFHWGADGVLSWDIRKLDANGYPTGGLVHAESHQLPTQFVGQPSSCITDVCGYGDASAADFSQMEAEICTNGYLALDGYKDNGVLDPNPASVPDLVGYGLPGDSSSPPPSLPAFLTGETGDTNSTIIYQQGGTVREFKQTPSWMALI